jgi:LacI family transcriptional regulator
VAAPRVTSTSSSASTCSELSIIASGVCRTWNSALQQMSDRIRRKATVRDIASETGLSIATVSRVLNNHAHVAARTRELVQQAVERLGARAPSPRTDSERLSTTPTAVYVRCPYPLTGHFGLIVSSIAETIQLHGRQLVLDAGKTAQHDEVLSALPHRTDIAGAILIRPPEPRKRLGGLRDAGFPFVIADPCSAVPRDIPAVSAAHFRGGRTVTQHLAELGHRRIGVLAGPHKGLAGRDRLAGHVSALADIGVLAESSLIRIADPATAFGCQAAGELLDLPHRPTAIVGFNDTMALGALAAAAERRIRVPRDLSVTCFEDSELAQAARPQLTILREPLEEIGRMAAGLLIRQLDRHPLHALHVELPAELLIRESTGPARNTPVTGPNETPHARSTGL